MSPLQNLYVFSNLSTKSLLSLSCNFFTFKTPKN